MIKQGTYTWEMTRVTPSLEEKVSFFIKERGLTIIQVVPLKYGNMQGGEAYLSSALIIFSEQTDQK